MSSKEATCTECLPLIYLNEKNTKEKKMFVCLLRCVGHVPVRSDGKAQGHNET